MRKSTWKKVADNEYVKQIRAISGSFTLEDLKHIPWLGSTEIALAIYKDLPEEQKQKIDLIEINRKKKFALDVKYLYEIKFLDSDGKRVETQNFYIVVFEEIPNPLRIDEPPKWDYSKDFHEEVSQLALKLKKLGTFCAYRHIDTDPETDFARLDIGKAVAYQNFQMYEFGFKDGNYTIKRIPSDSENLVKLG